MYREDNPSNRCAWRFAEYAGTDDYRSKWSITDLSRYPLAPWGDSTDYDRRRPTGNFGGMRQLYCHEKWINVLFTTFCYDDNWLLGVNAEPEQNADGAWRYPG